MTSSINLHNFDPILGYVQSRPFTHLPDVARRARSILGERSAEQIKSELHKISLEIDDYFNGLKTFAIDELRAKFSDDPETYQEFFEWDGGTRENGRWRYRDEMDEELNIPTAQNCSAVDALKTIIENRGETLFKSGGEFNSESRRWPEFRAHEIFSVLALGLLANCLRWTREGNSTENSRISGEYALEAMDAVCFAEHLREVEWLEQFQKKQLLEASTNQDERLGIIAEKVRISLIEEQIAHEREKKAIRSEQMNAARHQSTYNAKEMVCKDWEKNYKDFPSAEKAGNHYADWLEKRSIGYPQKGRLAFYQQRAVTGWIRQHAKEKGIKFR